MHTILLWTQAYLPVWPRRRSRNFIPWFGNVIWVSLLKLILSIRYGHIVGKMYLSNVLANDGDGMLIRRIRRLPRIHSIGHLLNILNFTALHVLVVYCLASVFSWVLVVVYFCWAHPFINRKRPHFIFNPDFIIYFMLFS